MNVEDETAGRPDSQTARRPDGQGETATDSPPPYLSDPPSFVIAELGLSSRHLWAAALEALARRDDVARAEVACWLRPAALLSRDGATLLLGVPHAAARDHIARRLLPAVREVLATLIGAPVEVEVVLAADTGEAR